jgi:hypothetical protein
LTVREALALGVEKHTRARMELEELAMKSMEYKLAEGTSVEDVVVGDHNYLSDEYKRSSAKEPFSLHLRGMEEFRETLGAFCIIAWHP